MGCKGLHGAIREFTVSKSISAFKNQRCAIDGFSWLHRAAYSDIKNISKGLVSKKVITSIINKVQVLQRYSINPIFVFDGLALPMKAKTNEHRKKQRDEARLKAAKFSALKDKKAEYKYLAASIHISWDLVQELMRELSVIAVNYIVAPYEADAQLGFLSSNNFVDFVMSEDSDLLLYGVSCMLTKYESDGSCIVVSMDSLVQSNVLPAPFNTRIGWILLCCLSGCDYTEGIYGIGIKKGAKLLIAALCGQKISFDTPDLEIKTILSRALQEAGGAVENNADQLKEMFHAFLTFKYHRVFDPLTESCINVTQSKEPLDINLDFLGDILEKSQICNLANGSLRPENFAETGLVACSYTQLRKPPSQSNVDARAALEPEKENQDTITHMRRRKSVSIYATSALDAIDDAFEAMFPMFKNVKLESDKASDANST